MDSDFHKIFNMQNEIINLPSPVHIGNHVWIGCRSTILKGVNIPDNSVVAAGSVMTKSFSESYYIYGGNNLRLKNNIDWKG